MLIKNFLNSLSLRYICKIKFNFKKLKNSILMDIPSPNYSKQYSDEIHSIEFILIKTITSFR